MGRARGQAAPSRQSGGVVLLMEWEKFRHVALVSSRPILYAVPTVLPSPRRMNKYRGTTFQIGQPPARIDILQHIDGVTFDEAWENRIEGIIDGQIQTAVISRDDLIQNKLATGPEQDILDVKKLRTAKQQSST
jgi:hypothetical protein